jgi:sugar O-acyltransferase (sialic acid O-acetyltransferase NeuD family)
MNNIVLIGGGGHCGAVIDVIEEMGQYRIAGIVDVEAKLGTLVRGYKIMATDDDLGKLVPEFRNFCLTTGHVGSARLRTELYRKLKDLGAVLPVIKSPFARVPSLAKIGEGTVIMHNSVVNVGTVLGVCNIINTGAIVEHDCTIGDHCHIAPGAVITGACKVLSGSFIGAGSVVIPGITVGVNAIVGAGSTVINDVANNTLVAGNPAKAKKQI